MNVAANENRRGPGIDVVIESTLWDAVPDAEAAVTRALTEAALAIGANQNGLSLALLLTDDTALRRLNAQWRGIDKPTNVLSFPSAPQIAGKSNGPTSFLGDIAIAYEITAHEAQLDGKPFLHHLAHLAVHGYLHLVGYDHERDSDAETMEQLECVILQRLGMPDPHRAHEELAPETLTHDIRG